MPAGLPGSEPAPPAAPLSVSGKLPKEQLAEDFIPPAPGVPPAPDIGGNYTDLVSRNPFRYEAGTGRSGADAQGKDPGIVLLDVKMLGGTMKAQLRVKSSGTEKWYQVDDAFEGFSVLSIDSSAKTVTVYVEEFKKQFTLSVTR